MLSTVFTADARFVLSGSDDGNVRVWKSNASEKLGIITARERAAIEYRDTLKERWKMDTQIGKVQRCVCEPSVAPLRSFLTRISIAEAGTSRSRFTRLRPSSVRCWRLSVSRRSAGESTRGQGTTSQRQRERRLSSRSRHELACVHYTFCPRLPTLPIEAGNCLYTLSEGRGASTLYKLVPACRWYANQQKNIYSNTMAKRVRQARCCQLPTRQLNVVLERAIRFAR